MSNHVFDDSFRKMAVELSYARGLVKEVDDELGILPSRLSKWRRRYRAGNSPALVVARVGLSDEQQESNNKV